MGYHKLLFSLSLSLCVCCSDIELIRDGIGSRLSILIQWVATFVSGFIIGFTQEWRLTLMLLGVVPFIAISVAVFSFVGFYCLCLFVLCGCIYCACVCASVCVHVYVYMCVCVCEGNENFISLFLYTHHNKTPLTLPITILSGQLLALIVS